MAPHECFHNPEKGGAHFRTHSAAQTDRSYPLMTLQERKLGG
jgi:hypothetical protein